MNLYWRLKRSIGEAKRKGGTRLCINLGSKRYKLGKAQLRTYPCNRWGVGFHSWRIRNVKHKG